MRWQTDGSRGLKSDTHIKNVNYEEFLKVWLTYWYNYLISKPAEYRFKKINQRESWEIARREEINNHNPEMAPPTVRNAKI